MFLFFSVVDQSKEATFKVAPSKWEAVDESELEAQGEIFKCHQTTKFCLQYINYLYLTRSVICIHSFSNAVSLLASQL